MAETNIIRDYLLEMESASKNGELTAEVAEHYDAFINAENEANQGRKSRVETYRRLWFFQIWFLSKPKRKEYANIKQEEAVYPLILAGELRSQLKNGSLNAKQFNKAKQKVERELNAKIKDSFWSKLFGKKQSPVNSKEGIYRRVHSWLRTAKIVPLVNQAKTKPAILAKPSESLAEPALERSDAVVVNVHAKVNKTASHSLHANTSAIGRVIDAPKVKTKAMILAEYKDCLNSLEIFKEQIQRFIHIKDGNSTIKIDIINADAVVCAALLAIDIKKVKVIISKFNEHERNKFIDNDLKILLNSAVRHFQLITHQDKHNTASILPIRKEYGMIIKSKNARGDEGKEIDLSYQLLVEIYNTDKFKIDSLLNIFKKYLYQPFDLSASSNDIGTTYSYDKFRNDLNKLMAEMIEIKASAVASVARDSAEREADRAKAEAWKNEFEEKLAANRARAEAARAADRAKAEAARAEVRAKAEAWRIEFEEKLQVDPARAEAENAELKHELIEHKKSSTSRIEKLEKSLEETQALVRALLAARNTPSSTPSNESQSSTSEASASIDNSEAKPTVKAETATVFSPIAELAGDEGTKHIAIH